MEISAKLFDVTILGSVGTKLRGRFFLLCATDSAAALEKLDGATDLYWLHAVDERWLEVVRSGHAQSMESMNAVREPHPADTGGAERNSNAGWHGTFRQEGE